MKVVAVVITYWPERRAHVPRIVRDLRAGTVVPDRILVLNNDPAATIQVEGADAINCGVNFETRAKYVVALLEPADYYLLLDDDCSVGRRTLEHLLKYARRGCAFGYWGVQLDGGPKGHQKIVMPDQIHVETPVNVFHGRAVFMAWDAVLRMLAVEEFVRRKGPWRYEGDDLLAGLANRATMIPMRGDEAFVGLDEEGVALHKTPGFGAMRERYIADAGAAIAEFGRPEW